MHILLVIDALPIPVTNVDVLGEFLPVGIDLPAHGAEIFDAVIKVEVLEVSGHIASVLYHDSTQQTDAPSLSLVYVCPDELAKEVP